MASKTALVFLFLCALAPCLSGNNTPPPAASLRLSVALEDLDRAVAGSSEAVEKTILRLGRLLEADPDHFPARAHLGNLYTLKARHVPLLSKRRWAERGFRELDAAVKGSEGDPEVRLIRAVNAYNLPKLLERHDIAQEDFRLLLQSLRENPEAFAMEWRKKVLFHAGAFALKENDTRAIPLLEEAEAIPVASALDRRIATMLRLARNQFER